MCGVVIASSPFRRIRVLTFLEVFVRPLPSSIVYNASFTGEQWNSSDLLSAFFSANHLDDLSPLDTAYHHYANSLHLMRTNSLVVVIVLHSFLPPPIRSSFDEGSPRSITPYLTNVYTLLHCVTCDVMANRGKYIADGVHSSGELYPTSSDSADCGKHLQLHQ